MPPCPEQSRRSSNPFPSEPDIAQVAVEGADDLYKEIRIENPLTDENGEKVHLKRGADVQVTVEAEPEATTAKDEKDPNASAA